MKRKVIPAIITTREALHNALVGEPWVLYIDEVLWQQEEKQLLRQLRECGYMLAEKQGKHGVFFVKNTFHPETCGIYDPWGIL